MKKNFLIFVLFFLFGSVTSISGVFASNILWSYPPSGSYNCTFNKLLIVECNS